MGNTIYKTTFESAIESEYKTNPKSYIESGPKTDNESEPKTCIETDPKTDIETESKTDIETGPKTDIETDPQTDIETDQKTDVEPSIAPITKHVMMIGTIFALPTTTQKAEEMKTTYLDPVTKTTTHYDQVLVDCNNTHKILEAIEKKNLQSITHNQKIVLKIGNFNEYCHGFIMIDDLCVIFEGIWEFTEELEILFSHLSACLPDLDYFENVKKVTFSPKDQLYPEDTKFIETFLMDLKNVKEVVFENIYPKFKETKPDITYPNIEVMTIKCDDDLMGCDFSFHRFPGLKELDISQCGITNSDKLLEKISKTLQLTELIYL
jgi:hypothetical protein